MSNNSIWLIDRTLSGATTPSKTGPESDGIEGVLRILQSSSITGASPSGYLVSYLGHSLGVFFYPIAEMQSVYCTAPAKWANQLFVGYLMPKFDSPINVWSIILFNGILILSVLINTEILLISKCFITVTTIFSVSYLIIVIFCCTF